MVICEAAESNKCAYQFWIYTVADHTRMYNEYTGCDSDSEVKKLMQQNSLKEAEKVLNVRLNNGYFETGEGYP